MGIATLARGTLSRLGVRPAPLSVGFEITHHCNLDCDYCDRHAPAPAEMTRDQILTALGGLADLGMRHVSLDGGEPLAHKHVDEVAAFLAQRRVRIYMNTNGILVPRKLAVVRLMSKVKISLDGPPEVHDAMRGAGSWQKAVNGAVVVRHSGVPLELTCVVARHNVDALDELVALADKHDFRVVFQPARPSLVADAHDGPAFQADAARVRAAFARLEQQKFDGSGAVANSWASLRHFRNFPKETPVPCAAGWINATLDPEGNLFACGQTPRRDRSHNVVAVGARAAFEKLARAGCGQCWCARVVEENIAWGGRFHHMLPPLSLPDSPARPPPPPPRRLPVIA